MYELRFEWNRPKAASNLEKHGVSFEEACEVFADEFAYQTDVPHDDELRYLIIGRTLKFKLLVVVFTERGENTRIISAREADSHERKQYEADK